MSLEQILLLKGIVSEAPSVDELIFRIRSKMPKQLTVFYGETYDFTGHPIDSLKYYFVTADLADALREAGFDANPVIMVADVAARRNLSEKLIDKSASFGEERFQFVQKVNRLYNTQLNVIRMSDYINAEDFRAKQKAIIGLCNSDPMLSRLIAKTVPDDKMGFESKNDFMYSFDEITIIMGMDIKLGPPREHLYDSIALEIAKRRNESPLIPLYLAPTFPIGKKWDYFFINNGIEKYGITPYKGGTAGLFDYRILLGRTNEERAAKLINDSFISTDPELPNPILDTALIVEMAKQRLTGKKSEINLYDRFYNQELSPDELKASLVDELKKYVLSRF